MSSGPAKRAGGPIAPGGRKWDAGRAWPEATNLWNYQHPNTSLEAAVEWGLLTGLIQPC